MKKFYSSFSRRMVLVAIALPIFSISASALNYTAVMSGNFNSGATWGGLAPAAISTADVVTIPAGYTVTLTADQTFNTTSQLIVNGALTSGINPTTLILTGGNLGGTGIITLDSMALTLVTGFTYTGNMTVQKLSTAIATIGSAANIVVGNTLNVTAGTLSITAGNVTMANNATIIRNGGTIAVSGTGTMGLTNNYHVTYLGAAAVAGVELTGTGLHNVTVDLTSGALALSGGLNVNGLLKLTAGNLLLSGYNLSFGATGDFSPLGLGNISSTLASNISVNAINSITGGLRFNTGGNTINNLTLNMGMASSMLSLGSDLNVNGTMALSAGTLTLNNFNLAFIGNGDFAASGTGVINATSASSLSILAANSFSGGIRFSNTGKTLDNVTINMSNNTSNVSLGSDLIVNDTLSLISGRINAGTSDLTIAATGTVTGGSTGSYVITGDGGNLIMHLVASSADTFHVGTAANYSPAVVIANVASANSDISVMVKEGVYSNGTSGYDLTGTSPLVDATWFISSSVTSGLDLNLHAMWSTAMEVNGFDRLNSYISHYAGNWDVMTTAPATIALNGLFVMTRNNVTSLSPFIVADDQSALEVGNVAAAKATVTIYPNPAVNTLNFTSAASLTGAAFYDVTGRLVKSVSITGNNSIPVADLAPGYYNVRFSGQDNNQVVNFIKQ